MSGSVFSLDGRIALITGSNAGIGHAIATAMTAAGARVAVNGRDAARVEAVATTISGAIAAPFDVADHDAARRQMDGIVAEAGGIDILVVCAAARDRRSFFAIEPADYRALLETNVVSTLQLARLAVERMRTPAHGRLIFLSATGAQRPFRGDPTYASSKAAVESLVRSLAFELGPRGTTANAIAPGFTLTQINTAWINDPAMSALIEQRVPAQRWGRPEEVANAAVFLASDAASYINGHVLAVDGGLAAVL